MREFSKPNPDMAPQPAEKNTSADQKVPVCTPTTEETAPPVSTPAACALIKDFSPRLRSTLDVECSSFALLSGATARQVSARHAEASSVGGLDVFFICPLSSVRRTSSWKVLICWLLAQKNVDHKLKSGL